MKRLGRAQQPHGEYATVRDGEPLAGFPPGRSGAPVGPTPTGEGCSTAGGCATCPYMKMNSLDALLALLERLGTAPPDELALYEPRKYDERIGGRTIAELGTESILHMRAFQRSGQLPDALVSDILTRTANEQRL